MFSFIGLDVSDTPVGLTWPLGAASLVLLDSSFSDVEVAVSEGVPGNGKPRTTLAQSFEVILELILQGAPGSVDPLRP